MLLILALYNCTCDRYVTCTSTCDSHVTCTPTTCDSHVTCTPTTCDRHATCTSIVVLIVKYPAGINDWKYHI